MNWLEAHRIHMVGIGGIGMSALARFLKGQGKHVSGYDRVETKLTNALQEEGIDVSFNPDPATAKSAELVIYTPAISKGHPELQAALQSGIPIQKRAEVLGEISRTFKTIAVAGTHGKTSTSGLIAHLLKTGGIDCTAFVGGILKNYHSNFLPGKSEWIVVEADEYDRSFLQLSPTLSVITSMDPDHLDIYHSTDEMQATYAQFVKLTQEEAYYEASLRLQAEGVRLTSYGIDSGDVSASNWKPQGLNSIFDVSFPGEKIEQLSLPLPGAYNIKNALAAIAIAKKLGISESAIREGLKTFEGIERRFDIHIRTEELVLVDDYAHHPEEVKAFLMAIRKMLPEWHILAIFQPHLYSRTKDFAPDFAASLSLADQVYLLPVYPAREASIPGVSSKLIYDLVDCHDKKLLTNDTLASMLNECTARPLAILNIGAGDSYRNLPTIKAKLLQKA